MSTVKPAACLVDDDADFRASFKTLMKSVSIPQLSFASAEEFLAGFEQKNIGCIVLDARLGGMSGLELLERLRSQNILIPVVLLTGHADVPLAVRAMRLGAIDVLVKPFKDDALIERIKEGIHRWDNLRKFQLERQSVAPRVASLTPREIEVLDLMVAGRKNRKIAEELGISTKTLDIHRANIMRKMQTKTVADLVRWRLVNRADPSGVIPMVN